MKFRIKLEITKNGNPIASYKFQRIENYKIKYMIGSLDWEYRLPKFIWKRL